MAYKDLGAVAVDAENGDISDNIVVTGADAVDDTTPGVYEVKYNVKDGDGVSADEVIRKVTVIDKDDFDFKVSFRGGNIWSTWIGTMYVSYDNGATYTPVDDRSIIDSSSGVIFLGKDVTSFGRYLNSDYGEVMVEKAFSITNLNSSFTGDNITKFEVAHKNVFPNATRAQYFLADNPNLESIPELNFPSMQDCKNMYSSNPKLKCVGGTLDSTSYINANNILDNCPLLTAPDAAGIAIIQGGGKWTNPGACP